ncbi:hypothetical protein GGTG_01886 [Gaeumannomyces tritici R3-111a-1]|uniref:RING zinc finger-like domain-containing protein n=1 Tax=Gaeumannomyces tritici (strain R3-111a-1) TaxID=644352 RepID=J3NKU5_GAET3|nr:hypothetical protein GGTG_01886 [Gaeumannomyces tritici R3-111a-1]EJT81912.1 hypothetical protein GGTG_01886 [Gaeumannomyces tritici R3-111a-1]
MPPRSSLTSSFSVTDSNNEVVCPLRNQDGSSCRKRCIGEKRYRSMQEHIRRAHPEHYISKLPATEESFHLMINTPPSERPPPNAAPGPRPPAIDHLKPGYPHDRQHGFRRDDNTSAPATPRNPDDYPPVTQMLPAASSAAAALAQLHSHPSLEPDWETGDAGWHSDTEKGRMTRASIELPPIHLPSVGITSEPFGGLGGASRQRDILPSILSTSPPGRSSTLPPLQRPLGPTRPRKQSVTKRGREAHHKKQRSRGTAADWLRRIQNDPSNHIVGGLGPGDRLRPGDPFSKAKSAEPTADYGKRWEDLIDAAASATEDIDEDRTPVGPRSPYLIDPALTYQVPQSPISVHRASLPPLTQQPFPNQASYQASPLQQALTPPSYIQEVPDPFPSVESGESGDNFHMESRGLSDSSPSYSSQNTQIYCAACQGVSLLKESYACTECISGLCPACVEVLMSEQGARRKCPRCATIGGRFKPFQLDIR